MKFNFDIDFKKNIKGITLIALVITIIVLLLLAGISISMLSGQDGILNKASNAKQETKKSEDYEYVVLTAQSALTEGIGKIDFENSFDTLGNGFNHLGEGLVEKDGKYYRVYEDGTVTKGGVKVGDVVTYTPPSVTDAKWSAEYSGLKDSDETATDIVLDNTLDITNENSFKVTSWRVLSIDDETINLVSKNPTTGKVFLGYANGYNNAVKLLDDSCDILYGDISKGIEGRSIKIEDIEDLMTEEGRLSINSYENKTGTKYGQQDKSAYTTYNCYPQIYSSERLSVINGEKKTVGLGLSEQDNKYYEGSVKPTTSIQPYQTLWAKNASDMKLYLGVTGSLTTSTNYELIMPEQENTLYWIASRGIGAGGVGCGFFIRYVNLGKVTSFQVYGSGGDLFYSNSLNIRPIVSVNYELLKGTEADGKMTWTIE